MDLGERLKGYESQYEQRVPYNEFLICRIDGHKFSKFTKGFEKPFDSILSEALIKTAADLLNEFGAVTSYHQSDEISLVFPPKFSVKLVPVDWKEVQIDCDNGEYIPEYRVFDREDNYIGYILTSFEPDEENYRITNYGIYDDDGRTIDIVELNWWLTTSK